MTVLAFCNVGLRDVTVEGRDIKPARIEGEKALAALEAAGAQGEKDLAITFAFPIIEPSLHYIVRRQQMLPVHDGVHEQEGGPAIDQLILFGTDQEQTEPKHRANDTLYFAELAARLLPQRVGDQVLGQARSARLQGVNPSLYDETFDLFSRLLAAWQDEDPTFVCYVILCGGTPAANTALLLQGVRYFGSRLRIIYTPAGGAPQELRAGLQVTRTFDEATAIAHLQRLDFVNARPLLQALQCGPDLLHLVDYAATRFNFDFDAAQAALDAALRDGDHTTRRFIGEQMPLLDLNALRANAEPVLTPDRLLALLRELYWNAQFTYDQGRYADFLGRVYRFQEAVLRYLVETVLDLPTDLSPAARERTLTAWRAGIESNGSLLTYLSQATYGGKLLDWMEINRPTYRALLKYALGEEGSDPLLGVDAAGAPLIQEKERKRFKALMDRVNALDRLIDLRHRTIIGHGFQGVSEATLLASIKLDHASDGPPSVLQTILNMLNLDTRVNPHRVVANYLIGRVRS